LTKLIPSFALFLTLFHSLSLARALSHTQTPSHFLFLSQTIFLFLSEFFLALSCSPIHYLSFSSSLSLSICLSLTIYLYFYIIIHPSIYLPVFLSLTQMKTKSAFIFSPSTHLFLSIISFSRLLPSSFSLSLSLSL